MLDHLITGALEGQHARLEIGDLTVPEACVSSPLSESYRQEYSLAFLFYWLDVQPLPFVVCKEAPVPLITIELGS